MRIISAAQGPHTWAVCVQITAEPWEQSIWLETTTELIRRCRADWMKMKAVFVALCWQGSLPVCKLDFPQLHLTVPMGLKWKTLKGPGMCVGGIFDSILFSGCC